MINKIDLAPLVGASLHMMDRDATKMRADRRFIFTNVREGSRVEDIVSFVGSKGDLSRHE